MLVNHVCWWWMLFYTRLLLLLQPPVLWLSIVTFNNDAKLPPKWILREFSIANPTPAKRVTPPWNVYMAKFDPGWEDYPVWPTGLPSLAGHLTYHVNVIKLNWEIIWKGGLPHLPGVPHLHVNSPLRCICPSLLGTNLNKAKYSVYEKLSRVFSVPGSRFEEK